HPSTTDRDPVDLAREGVAAAKAEGADLILLDTAGRLQIDEVLMEELARIKSAITPHEILFVADAMTGQEAVNVARGFNDRLNLSGIVLTKMDGDARGGAALSIRAITQKPVKFVTVGEKLDALEAFHPERVASRILGMGDLLSLIEKVETNYSEKAALQVQQKLRHNEFDLDDFRAQLRSMRKMGSVKDLLSMLPGMDASMLKQANLDNRQFVRIEAIISSMTPQERRKPQVVNGSRRSRIAKGSGRQVSEINRLLKQFTQIRKMMVKLSRVRDPGRAMRVMQDMMQH
ncbi:MAG: signal recognition particle protein, partial [SAR324 cluster bacterium]|nr:signal recognition particle protein [SAR324 cluster bacterium]